MEYQISVTILQNKLQENFAFTLVIVRFKKLRWISQQSFKIVELLVNPKISLHFVISCSFNLPLNTPAYIKLKEKIRSKLQACIHRKVSWKWMIHFIATFLLTSLRIFVFYNFSTRTHFEFTSCFQPHAYIQIWNHHWTFYYYPLSNKLILSTFWLFWKRCFLIDFFYTGSNFGSK